MFMSSRIGAAPIPDDKKGGCIVTMVMTKNDLMIFFMSPSVNEPSITAHNSSSITKGLFALGYQHYFVIMNR